MSTYWFQLYKHAKGLFVWYILYGVGHNLTVQWSQKNLMNFVIETTVYILCKNLNLVSNSPIHTPSLHKRKLIISLSCSFASVYALQLCFKGEWLQSNCSCSAIVSWLQSFPSHCSHLLILNSMILGLAVSMYTLLSFHFKIVVTLIKSAFCK